MKKLIRLIITLVALFSFSVILFMLKAFQPEIFEDYSNWQTIEIENCGTFKVPEEWVINERNGFMYFTNGESDPDSRVYMFQTYIRKYINERGKSVGLYNPEFGKFLKTDSLSNGIFPNNAGEEKNKYLIEGVEYVKYEIGFGNSEVNVSFIMMDDSIDETTRRKIAISYSES